MPPRHHWPSRAAATDSSVPRCCAVRHPRAAGQRCWSRSTSASCSPRRFAPRRPRAGVRATVRAGMAPRISGAATGRAPASWMRDHGERASGMAPQGWVDIDRWPPLRMHRARAPTDPATHKPARETSRPATSAVLSDWDCDGGRGARAGAALEARRPAYAHPAQRMIADWWRRRRERPTNAGTARFRPALGTPLALPFIAGLDRLGPAAPVPRSSLPQGFAGIRGGSTTTP